MYSHHENLKRNYWLFELQKYRLCMYRKANLFSFIVCVFREAHMCILFPVIDARILWELLTPFPG